MLGLTAHSATPSSDGEEAELWSNNQGSRVDQSCVTCGDVSVYLSTHHCAEPFDKLISARDEFRLGMVLSPASAFRGSFIGTGIDDFGTGVHPLCLPPNLALRSVGKRGSHREVTVNFSKTRFIEQTGHSGDMSRAELRACLAIMNQNIAATLRRLADEVSGPGLASNLMVEALTSSLVIDLSRQLAHADGDTVVGRVTLSRRQLALIEERTYQDGPAPSVKELGELCDLSGRQLVRLFKRATGKTLHEFVEGVRLERATEMLASTSLPLKEISYRLGFSAPSNFSIAFRRLTGTSPRSYRRTVRLSSSSQIAVASPSIARN